MRRARVCPTWRSTGRSTHGTPGHERGRRVRLDSGTCVIEENSFIRGVIEIPLPETGGSVGLGVRVSREPGNFRPGIHKPASDRIGPLVGLLPRELEFGGRTTLNLKTMAHFPGGDQRPRIEIGPGSHPLADARRDGMTLAQAWELVHAHGDPQA